jgi:hypothetical protein
MSGSLASEKGADAVNGVDGPEDNSVYQKSKAEAT